jgi:hypothetical protein
VARVRSTAKRPSGSVIIITGTSDRAGIEMTMAFLPTVLMRSAGQTARVSADRRRERLLRSPS